MFSYRTQGFNGYSVSYSPYFDSRLACAASSNFGLVGNGRLYILDLTPQGITCHKWFDTQDGLFDCAWSELHENQIAVASGDGSIKLFDIGLNDFPTQSWQEHTREVFSINWNLVEKTTFCSSSWDGAVKIWSPSRPRSLMTLVPRRAPPSCTYTAMFSPHDSSAVASCSSDSMLRIWDVRAPEPEVSSILAHNGAEVLTLDWNKYRPTVLATGSVDRSIRIWDVRQPTSPINEMLGHEYAVKRISWSPHSGEILLSVSYDMTARIWRDSTAQQQGLPGSHMIKHRRNMLGIFDKHTEFVTGCDWSLFGAPGWACTTGWDEKVFVWDAKAYGM